MASGDRSGPGRSPAAGVAAVADLIDRHRPAGRRLRRLIALLTEQPPDLAGQPRDPAGEPRDLAGGPRDLAALVRESALPRRTVESVLAAMADDLRHDGAGVAIQPAKVAAYRERFGYDELMRTELTDPLAQRLAAAAPVVARMAELRARVPPARADLDHVPATAETAVRRALWLDSSYDLAGAVLLCAGDHDLTSVAVALVNRGAAIVVVDVDERTLEFIDAQRTGLGLDIRCFAGDLRFGLPEPAAGCADLVFTDPPYTPEGVGLFVARGLQGLGNRENGRVIVAYGYSERHPTLGVQVQSVAPRLGLAYEALLPAFNRYDGAEAVGSASDLYVWRPTSRTWRGLDRFLAGAEINIYTRGTHALEKNQAAGGALPPAVRQAAESPPAARRAAERGPAAESAPAAALAAESPPAAALAAESRLPIKIIVADRWHDPGEGIARLPLGTLLSGGIPPGMAGRDPFAVVADLAADPGPWLLRLLLAANAVRVVAVVPSGHPDVRDEAAQRSIGDLVRPKYELRFLRSQPDNWHTIVVADAVDPGRLDTAGRLAQRLLSRAHGKAGNVWREGLLRARQERDGEPLTKREARALVAARARRADVLDAPLIALPRHTVAQLLDDAAASAKW